MSAPVGPRSCPRSIRACWILAVDRLTSPCASRARSFRQASSVASPTKRGDVSVFAPVRKALPAPDRIQPADAATPLSPLAVRALDRLLRARAAGVRLAAATLHRRTGDQPADGPVAGRRLQPEQAVHRGRPGRCGRAGVASRACGRALVRHAALYPPPATGRKEARATERAEAPDRWGGDPRRPDGCPYTPAVAVHTSAPRCTPHELCTTGPRCARPAGTSIRLRAPQRARGRRSIGAGHLAQESWCGYVWPTGASNVSLIARGVVQRMQVQHRAGLVVGARGAGAAEGLLADDRAGGLVVDVEVARGEAQRPDRRSTAARSVAKIDAGQRVRATASIGSSIASKSASS